MSDDSRNDGRMTYDDILKELESDVTKSKDIYDKVEENFSMLLARITKAEKELAANPSLDRKRKTPAIATRDLTFLSNMTANLSMLKTMKTSSLKDIVAIRKQQFAEEMRLKEFAARANVENGGGLDSATIEIYSKEILSKMGLMMGGTGMPTPSVPVIDLDADDDTDALLMARLGSDYGEEEIDEEEEPEYVNVMHIAPSVNDYELIALVSEETIELRLRHIETRDLIDVPSDINEDLIEEEEDGTVLYGGREIPHIDI